MHHSRKQGITGVLLNNRRLRVLVFSFLHTFFQGIVFQHPPTPMTWVGRCDALPCPPPPPPPQKSLVLDTLEVTVLSADESLSESKNGATCTFSSIYVYVCVCTCVLKPKTGFMCMHRASYYIHVSHASQPLHSREVLLPFKDEHLNVCYFQNTEPTDVYERTASPMACIDISKQVRQMTHRCLAHFVFR